MTQIDHVLTRHTTGGHLAKAAYPRFVGGEPESPRAVRSGFAVPKIFPSQRVHSQAKVVVTRCRWLEWFFDGMDICSVTAIYAQVLWLRRSIPTKIRADVVAVFDQTLT